MSQTETAENKGLGRKVQAFGSFLSSMIMPNIGAFIAWGLIASIFIKGGWWPNKELGELASPMISYLIPLLIAYSGGRLIHEMRGGIIAAVATMGVIVALPDNNVTWSNDYGTTCRLVNEKNRPIYTTKNATRL